MRNTDLTSPSVETPVPRTVRVTLIEDVREVRESLTLLINGTPGFACAHSYRSMEDALTGIDGSTVDVILTDIGLPGMGGVEGTRVLRGADVTRSRTPRPRPVPAVSATRTQSRQSNPQELTLLKLMVEGHHYKTAATEMRISINTVSFHLRHIYEKLEVHSKTEAVARALREGLI